MNPPPAHDAATANSGRGPERRSTAEVYRDRLAARHRVLRGICHCGAEHRAEDPVEMWAWLLGHPDGHRPPIDQPAAPTAPGEPAEPGPPPMSPAGRAAEGPAIPGTQRKDTAVTIASRRHRRHSEYQNTLVVARREEVAGTSSR